MKKTTQSDFFVYIPKTGFSNEDCRVRRFSAYFDISILDHFFGRINSGVLQFLSKYTNFFMHNVYKHT